jgi:hemerythrin-like domain-containing protein
MPLAVAIIENEHRAFAAVLHGLLYVVEQARKHGKDVDFRLLGAMLDYIEAFPEKQHHPKEDDYVFRILRRRDPAAAATLDELEAQHRRGREQIAHLRETLRAAERDPSAFPAFATAVHEYADFSWAHMRKEEDEVLPRAQKALTAEDWQEIDAAFRSNDDPLAGVDAQKEMRELFRRVINLAPVPIGLGPERQ